MIWDTHAHLNDRKFAQDQKQTLDRAVATGVTTIVNVGYDEKSSRASVALAEKYPFIYATIGVHPHDAKSAAKETWSSLLQLSRHPKVVAWGEIGLDYYRDLSPRNVQQHVFIEQIELANEVGLPIVIHDRDAHGDILKIIKEHPPEMGGVFHSFAGSWEMAKEVLKRGFYISFSGPLTYRNAKHSLEVAKEIPLDRFLVETDCPYLTPEPKRGRRNEPAYVLHTAEKLAEIKGLPFDEIAAFSSENARKFFGV